MKKKYVCLWLLYFGFAAGMWLAKGILSLAGIEFRIWLDMLIFLITALFPAIMIGWHISRIPLKNLSIVLMIIYSAAAVLLLTTATFLKILHLPAEYDLGAGILSLGESGFLDKTTYTYWDKVSFFGRKSFTWDEEHDIRILSEKYGTQFHKAEGEEGYISEQYPELVIQIAAYPAMDIRDMDDGYPQKIAESVFLEAAQQERLVDRYTRSENSEFVLICTGESSIDRTAQEASALIRRALEEKVFETYAAYLSVRVEVGERYEEAQLWFQKSESARYKDSAYAGEVLKEFYQNLEEKYTEEFVQEKEESDYDGEERVSEMEAAYDHLYKDRLSEEYTMNEKKYNAKGNFYAVLEEGTEEYQGQADVPYDITLVYDRVSDDGVSQLFVLYKNYYFSDENGQTSTETKILTGYSVNMVTKEIETYEVNW